jgi:hypothetical protein
VDGKTERRSGRLIRVIYAVSLLVATANHASTLILHGLFWTYGGAPLPTVVFWTGLTVADPAAAALLFLKPRLGVILTAVIIVADVLHNVLFAVIERRAHPVPVHPLAYWQMGLQVVFMVFVLFTARIAWPDARGAHTRP